MGSLVSRMNWWDHPQIKNSTFRRPGFELGSIVVQRIQPAQITLPSPARSPAPSSPRGSRSSSPRSAAARRPPRQRSPGPAGLPWSDRRCRPRPGRRTPCGRRRSRSCPARPASGRRPRRRRRRILRDLAGRRFERPPQIRTPVRSSPSHARLFGATASMHAAARARRPGRCPRPPPPWSR